TVHVLWCCFFFSSRRRHTRSKRDWSSDVCSSDLRVGSFRFHPWLHLVATSHFSGARGQELAARTQFTKCRISPGIFCQARLPFKKNVDVSNQNQNEHCGKCSTFYPRDQRLPTLLFGRAQMREANQ